MNYGENVFGPKTETLFSTLNLNKHVYHQQEVKSIQWTPVFAGLMDTSHPLSILTVQINA